MLPCTSPQMIYTLQKGDTCLSVMHRRIQYLVGFQKVMHARKVHYSIHMNPQLLLLRDTNIDLHGDLMENGYDLNLTLDVHSVLFVPKNTTSCMDAIYDGCFTMRSVKETDFLKIPIFNPSPTGIIMPYDLIDETEDEFMFRSYVIDPLTKT